MRAARNERDSERRSAITRAIKDEFMAEAKNHSTKSMSDKKHQQLMKELYDAETKGENYGYRHHESDPKAFEKGLRISRKEIAKILKKNNVTMEQINKRNEAAYKEREKIIESMVNKAASLGLSTKDLETYRKRVSYTVPFDL